jgi:hypothetical protein
VRPGPRRALGEPGGERLAELGAYRNRPGFLALSDQVNLALAGGQPDVADIHGGNLGEAGSGVQRQRVAVGPGALQPGQVGTDGAAAGPRRVAGQRRAPPRSQESVRRGWTTALAAFSGVTPAAYS